MDILGQSSCVIYGLLIIVYDLHHEYFLVVAIFVTLLRGMMTLFKMFDSTIHITKMITYVLRDITRVVLLLIF
jgi:hypothetical protein